MARAAGWRRAVALVGLAVTLSAAPHGADAGTGGAPANEWAAVHATGVVDDLPESPGDALPDDPLEDPLDDLPENPLGDPADLLEDDRIPIETVLVDSRSQIPARSLGRLVIGGRYQLEARGVYLFALPAGAVPLADAMCSTLDGRNWVPSRFSDLGEEYLRLHVDGVAVEWVPFPGTERLEMSRCSLAHFYRFDMLGHGRLVELFIKDLVHADNAGWIVVQIFRVA